MTVLRITCLKLETIRQLHKFHPDLAIGMEYFQQPFQKYLNEDIAGNLTEKALLKATEYYDRWKYDYRLYRPILRYARSHRISLVALNIPQEIAFLRLFRTQRSYQQGIAETYSHRNWSCRCWLSPARLKQVWEHHSNIDFNHFLEAQLLLG